MASTKIELEERFEVPLSRDQAWELMTDPETVVAFIPGAEITGIDDEGVYQGTIALKLGPTKVCFKGTVAVDFDHDGHVGELRARGADAKGRTRATAAITFRLTKVSPPGSSDGASTEVRTDAVFEMAGALASFLSSGGAHLARRMLREFAANVTGHAAGMSQTDRNES